MSDFASGVQLDGALEDSSSVTDLGAASVSVIAALLMAASVTLFYAIAR